ncbi:glycosyl transferase family 41-domain-containing protein [Absidia repens]|uniref:protein O-GlcNAc transferase n=1 Tax=Absidia repens TaxID=90262 RepID=A0A1X2ILI3_9FUNG|nr:glycosyl transferase family 41-domain-containing protein [Absidia repens]
MLQRQHHTHQTSCIQMDDNIQNIYCGKNQQPILDTNVSGDSNTRSWQQHYRSNQSSSVYSQTRQSQQQHTQALQQQQQQQQSFLSQFIPSVMLPPPSPTLSSYNYEEENGWVNNYYGPKRQQQLSCRAVKHSQKSQQQCQPDQQEQQQYQHQSNQQQPGHSSSSKTLQEQLLKERIQSATSSQLESGGGLDNEALKHTQSSLLSQVDVSIQQQSLPSSPPATTFPMHTQWTPELRESLLQYAHTLYSTTPSSPLLLSLLHSMHDAYPTHLPTILLLACVYYSHQDYISSLQFNQLILKYDPQYVEAMSNIGTTLRVLGRTSEAEKWWYQAVRLRPGYWDAVENLVGVLCSTPSSSTSTLAGSSKLESDMITTSSSSSQEKQHMPDLVSRFRQALEVCGFVENYFYKSGISSAVASGENGSGISAPRRLPALQIPRLQNLFYAKGNLRSALGDVAGAQLEYEKGLELVFGGSNLVSIIHLLALVCGSTMAAAATRLGKTLDATSLPLVLLQPDQVTQVMQLMFPHTAGLLPGLVGLCANTSKQHTQSKTTPVDTNNAGNTQSLVTSTAVRQTMQTTSTILLNLAKLFQDQMNSPPKADKATIRPTLSMLVPLYYFSLSLNPSPSTANNLGIILSNLSGVVCSNAVQLVSSSTPPLPLTGTMRAMQFYMYGLQLDAQHPHLYTNLGSLLKDMGHLQEAICMYEKAVEFNPRFDVALANLGNAIKDQGRVQDSVQFYRRAVQANPGFVDAICGLVNSLGGVCDWRGRGTVDGTNEPTVDDDGKFVPAGLKQKQRFGWMEKLVDIVDKQLTEGSSWGQQALQLSSQQLQSGATIGEHLIQLLATFTCASTTMVNGNNINGPASSTSFSKWHQQLEQWRSRHSHKSKNEGGWLIRLLERVMRRMQRHWYIKEFGGIVATEYAQASITVDPQNAQHYQRPQIPDGLSSPPVPTVLPFHTFTYPLSARQIRLISHRNALRISHSTLTSSWVASHVYPPPPPPSPRLKIGYVSSDFNNHPLAHLMQSVFGFHDRQRYDVYCYATTPTDSTSYRQKIENETEHFLDVSQWSNQQVVQQIVKDGIHVLVNLNGYTKGARNEIFAARPCPVQCSFMGFAGTLGGGWVDYIVADPIVCPPATVSSEIYRTRQQSLQRTNNNSESYGDFEGDVDPEEPEDDFVYTEKFIYMPHSYFVNDHKQGFQEDDDTAIDLKQNNNGNNSNTAMTPDQRWKNEENRRWSMRHEVFPGLPDDVVIFANFNQLYKLEPSTFKLWLRILERVPNSVLWLLRFPPAGEQHLKKCASNWSGDEVAQRILFTDVAPKQIHIHRGRVADIFLDTPECNAHTTAADILWSGTPMITYPKYDHKMCSRVGASIAYATGYGDEMVVPSEQAYEDRAVQWATGLSYHYTSADQLYGLKHDARNTDRLSYRRMRQGRGALMDLRQRLFLTREQSRLFDTERWTRNLEQGFSEAWRRWVTGEEMEDVSPSSLDYSGCIWVADPDDGPHEDLL